MNRRKSIAISRDSYFKNKISHQFSPNPNTGEITFGSTFVADNSVTGNKLVSDIVLPAATIIDLSGYVSLDSSSNNLATTGFVKATIAKSTIVVPPNSITINELNSNLVLPSATTATTQSLSSNNNSVATTSYVNSAISNFSGGVPTQSSFNALTGRVNNHDISLNNLVSQANTSDTNMTFLTGRVNNHDTSLNNLVSQANILDTSMTYFNGSYDVSFNKNVYLSGSGYNVFSNGKLIASSDVSMNQNLSVAEDASLNSNLYVGGNITLSSDNTKNIIIKGNTTFNNAPYMSGANITPGTISFGSISGGFVDLTSNQNISGVKTFSSRIVGTSDASVNGNLSVGGNTLLTGSSTYTGTAIYNGDASLNANLLVAGNITLSNDISKKITIKGNAIFNSAPYLSGANITATTIPDIALQTITTAGKVANSATSATTANTASTIVLRDTNGYISAVTQTAGTNNTAIATTAFVSTAIGNLVNGAPGILDTLSEIATAINGDASFGTTITTRLNNTDGSVNSILKNTTLVAPLDASVNGSLNIGGTSIHKGTAIFNGDASLNANLLVVGNVILSNDNTKTITINGNTTFNSAPYMSGANILPGTIATGAISGTSGVDLSSNQTIGGVKTFTSRIVGTSDASINGNLSVGGNTLLTGISTHTGTAIFNSDASLNANLLVAGNITLSNDNTKTITIKGNTTFNSAPYMSGANITAGTIPGGAISGGFVDLTTTQTIGGVKTFTSRIVGTSDASINGNLSVGGNISTNTNLAVGGSSTMTGTAIFNGDASLNANLLVAGNITLSDANTKTITIKGNTTFNSAPYMSGANITAGTIPGGAISGGFVDLTTTQTIGGVKTFTSRIVGTSDASVNGNLSVGGNISTNTNLAVGGLSTMTGTAIFNGDASLNANLLVAGNITLSDANTKTITIKGNTTFNSAPYMSGANITAGTIPGGAISGGFVDLSTNQTIGGIKTFTSRIVGTNDASVNGNLSVGGNISTNTNLAVGGSSTMTGTAIFNGDASLNANLLVAGNITLSNDNTKTITIKGNTTFNSAPYMSGANITPGTIPAASISGSTGVDLTTNQTIGGIKTFTSRIGGLSDLSINGNINVGIPTTYIDASITPIVGMNADNYVRTGYAISSLNGTYDASASSGSTAPYRLLAYGVFSSNRATWISNGNANYLYSTSSPYNYIGISNTYVDSSYAYGEWIQIKIPTPVSVTGYTLKTRYNSTNTAIHSPGEYIFVGSNDGTNWKSLSIYGSGAFKSHTYTFSNLDPYTYFRLVFTRGAGNGDVGIEAWDISGIVIKSPISGASITNPDISMNGNLAVVGNTKIGGYLSMDVDPYTTIYTDAVFKRLPLGGIGTKQIHITNNGLIIGGGRERAAASQAYLSIFDGKNIKYLDIQNGSDANFTTAQTIQTGISVPYLTWLGGCAISAEDGKYIVINDSTLICVSRDYGNSWTKYPMPGGFQLNRNGQSCMSANGKFIAINGDSYASSNGIAFSSDYGNTWSRITGNPSFNNNIFRAVLGMSRDGSLLALWSTDNSESGNLYYVLTSSVMGNLNQAWSVLNISAYSGSTVGQEDFPNQMAISDDGDTLYLARNTGSILKINNLKSSFYGANITISSLVFESRTGARSARSVSCSMLGNIVVVSAMRNDGTTDISHYYVSKDGGTTWTTYLYTPKSGDTSYVSMSTTLSANGNYILIMPETSKSVNLVQRFSAWLEVVSTTSLINSSSLINSPSLSLSANNLTLSSISTTIPGNLFLNGNVKTSPICDFNISGNTTIRNQSLINPLWSSSADITLSTPIPDILILYQSSNTTGITITFPIASPATIGCKLIIRRAYDPSGAVISATSNIVPNNSNGAGTAILSISERYAQLICGPYTTASTYVWYIIDKS